MEVRKEVELNDFLSYNDDECTPVVKFKAHECAVFFTQKSYSAGPYYRSVVHLGEPDPGPLDFLGDDQISKLQEALEFFNNQHLTITIVTPSEGSRAYQRLVNTSLQFQTNIDKLHGCSGVMLFNEQYAQKLTPENVKKIPVIKDISSFQVNADGDIKSLTNDKGSDNHPGKKPVPKNILSKGFRGVFNGASRLLHKSKHTDTNKEPTSPPAQPQIS